MIGLPLGLKYSACNLLHEASPKRRGAGQADRLNQMADSLTATADKLDPLSELIFANPAGSSVIINISNIQY